MPDSERGSLQPTTTHGDVRPHYNGLNLADIMRIFWHRKIVLLASVILFVFAAIVYLNVATYRYTAVLMVVPAQTDSGRMPSGIAGLASLAGVNLPIGQGATPFGLYQESILGRAVADELGRDPQLMRNVFWTRWNVRTNRWQLDKGYLGKATDILKSLLGLPVYQPLPPTAEDLQRFLKANTTVIDDERRGTVTIEFKYKDPNLSKKILWKLHKTTDNLLRNRILVRSSNYIDYLEKKLKTVSISEHRTVLTQILSDQEQLRMVASSGLPFAAAPLADISVSSRPTDPKPLFVITLAGITGLLAGLLIIFLSSGIWRIR